MHVFTANTMKKELIELDSIVSGSIPADSFEVRCHLLQLLLNPKITSICLPYSTLRTEEENLAASTDLCHSLLAARLPELHTLTSSYSSWETQGDMKLLILNNILDTFSTIEVLNLGQFVLDDTDLCRIADQLPKLRYLIIILIYSLSDI